MLNHLLGLDHARNFFFFSFLSANLQFFDKRFGLEIFLGNLRVDRDYLVNLTQ